MFNLGMGEITIILLLALIFLGPKKLPELASGLGKLIREIRKTTSDVKNEIQLDEIIRKPMEELREAMTLHPEELKRRDRLKKELEELKRKAEEAHQLAQSESGGESEPDPQDVAEQAAAAEAGGTTVSETGASVDRTIPEGVSPPTAPEAARASTDLDAAADVKTPAPVPQIPRSAPTGTVARDPSSAIPAAPAPATASAGHAPPAPPLAAVLTRAPAAPATPERRTGTAGTDFLRSLRAVPDARQTTPSKPHAPAKSQVPPDAANSAADRSNITQTLTEADLASITVGSPPPPPAPAGQAGKTQPPPPPTRLPGATPPKTSNR